MRILFLSLILLSSTTRTFAERSLTPQAYQSNVKPVLKGIINDFYQMISLFPDFPKEIIGLIGKMNSLEEFREDLRLACPRTFKPKCQEQIDKLRERLSLIEAKTFELIVRQKIDQSIYMNTLVGMRLINDFQGDLSAFKGSLDNNSFLMRAKIIEKTKTYKVLKKINDLQTMFSLVIVEFIPFQYKDIFRHFYFNFVRPVEVQLFKQRDHKYLLQNMNALNFSVNLLNQKLTKRNKKPPENMAPYLSLIHNRWNNLLRYYF